MVGYLAGGVLRGALVAVSVSLILFPMIGLGVAHPLLGLLYVVLGGAFLGALGVIAGVFANKFDQMAAITNFIVMPLSFLSGTFYSLDSLPPFMQALSHANPVFYLIDGVRFATLGVSDSSPLLGLGVILLALAVVTSLGWWMFRTGYRLKA